MNALRWRFYVFARGLVGGTMSGFGYIETGAISPERALWEAQQQPWPIGTELGVAGTLNAYAVESWVPAQRQVQCPQTGREDTR